MSDGLANGNEYDVFISHASEDKEPVARPLAQQLRERNLRVWFDEFELTIGDSLTETIDRGLISSNYGVVILSESFFEKRWTLYEFKSLKQRQLNDDGKVILPLWYGIGKEDILNHSPSLADLLAREICKENIPKIADEICNVVTPEQTARSVVNGDVMRTGNGESLQQLEGVGRVLAAEFVSAGVSTPEDLLGADPDILESQVSASNTRIQKWREQAISLVETRELLEIPGIGPRTAVRLATNSIWCLNDLADANAETLAEESRLPLGQIESWISSAQELQGGPITDIYGIGKVYADRLKTTGIESIKQLAETDFETVASQARISDQMAMDFVTRARDRIEDESISSQETESEKVRLESPPGEELQQIRGIGPAHASELHDAGVETLEDLKTALPRDIAQHTPFGVNQVREWVVATNSVSEKPVETLDGIGPVGSKHLKSLDITTVGQLALTDPSIVSEERYLSAKRMREWVAKARSKLGENDTNLGRDESVEILDGIGPRSKKQLEGLGITTVNDLAQADPSVATNERYLTVDRMEKSITEARDWLSLPENGRTNGP